MDIANIENTLKKMGLIIEKLVKKVDELDKKINELEKKESKKFSSEDLKSNQSNLNSVSQSSSVSNLGSSFLGSMAGAMAGMGLYNLLFNNHVSPTEFGQNLGMNEKEISEMLESDFNEIESKLEEIDAKLKELDNKLDENTTEDVMANDYFESYEEELGDNDFDSGFDDFEV